MFNVIFLTDNAMGCINDELSKMNIKLPQQSLHVRTFVWYNDKKQMFRSDFHGATRHDDFEKVSAEV